VREADRRRGRHAAAALTDVDLDEHVESRAGGLESGGEAVDPERRVHRDRQADPTRQRREAGKLRLGNDLVADIDVDHAGRGQRLRLRLADLLDADADRAGAHLERRDDCTLVHLRVRAQAHAMRPREIGHGREVALHGVEVDHQRRCADGVDRVADARCRGGAHPGARTVRAPLPAAAPSMSSSSASPSRWPVSAQPTSVKPCGV
jgi:hypothetical protein